MVNYDEMIGGLNEVVNIANDDLGVSGEILLDGKNEQTRWE